MKYFTSLLLTSRILFAIYIWDNKDNYSIKLELFLSYKYAELHRITISKIVDIYSLFLGSNTVKQVNLFQCISKYITHYRLA